MANSAGVSGPFNPSIGLGLAQDGVASPQCVIGVAAANLASTAQTGVWGRSASGNFIGISSNKTVSYKQSYGGSTPPTVDFDPTFKPAISDEVLPGLSTATYTQITAPDQYKFKTASVVTTVTVVNGPSAVHTTGTPVTATVLDQSSNPMAGVSVAFAATGGTATGPVITTSPATTNASGVASVTVTAGAAGTVTGTVTASGFAAQPFSVTLT